MDHEVQETVESILGVKGVKVVDCEKKSSIREEEVLLINGCPIPLEGEDGVAIREALIHGNVPNCDLLNQILIRAGILKAPVRLETSLSVKSSVVTREEVTVAKKGQIVDERTRETKEDNFYTSNTSEVWEPVGYEPLPLKKKGCIKVIDGYPKSGSNSSTFRSSSSCSSGNRTEPSTSTDSAFFPSDTHQHSSSATYHHQPGSSNRGPNRTNSSTSADSANSFSKDTDFLPPQVNASSSPFIPNCSRTPHIPNLNNSNTTTTTTKTVIDPYGNEKKSTTVEKSRSETNRNFPTTDDRNGDCSGQLQNGFSRIRLEDLPGATQKVRYFVSFKKKNFFFDVFPVALYLL